MQERYVHWLLLSLSDQTFSFDLPFPVRNREGATFLPVDDVVWVLAPHLTGQRMQPNDPDQAYAVGEALAELHQGLAKVQPHVRPDFPEYNMYRRTLLHLRGTLPTVPGALGLQETPEGWHRLRRFMMLAKQFQVAPPVPDENLHWHIVHGDFFGANLLYNGERVSGVLDFKFARPDYRVREFAETLLRVANDFGPLFWGTARSFVEGYAQHVNLTRAEIELAPRFMVEFQVDQVLFYATAEPARAATALRIQEDISSWLEVEVLRLEAMMRGVFLGE